MKTTEDIPQNYTKPAQSRTTSKKLRKMHWLSLVHVIDHKNRHRYDLSFYQIGNRNFTKTIAFTEKEALEKWTALQTIVPTLDSDFEKKLWINERTATVAKRHPDKAKEIVTGQPKTFKFS